MDELLSEFLTEANESLADLDNGLLRLEQNPNDLELLSEIFRVVHTIKGTCGFLGLPRLGAVAHVAEDVLGKFRDGDLAVTPDSVTVIFEALDCLKSLLGHLEETEKEPEGNDDEIIARLREIADAAGPEVTAEDMEAAFEAASAKPQEEIMSSAQDSQAELDKAVAAVNRSARRRLRPRPPPQPNVNPPPPMNRPRPWNRRSPVRTSGSVLTFSNI